MFLPPFCTRNNTTEKHIKLDVSSCASIASESNRGSENFGLRLSPCQESLGEERSLLIDVVPLTFGLIWGIMGELGPSVRPSCGVRSRKLAQLWHKRDCARSTNKDSCFCVQITRQDPREVCYVDSEWVCLLWSTDLNYPWSSC